MTDKGTIHYFEWARALGALAVVCVHVVVGYFNVGYLIYTREAWWTAETLLAIPLTRWAVPVFLMMSGALLLDPKRDMPPAKLAHHIWRVAFVLGTIGYAFCLIESYVGLGAVTPALFAESAYNLLTGNSWGHLWYLYSLLGLYVLTPALRVAARRLSARGLAALIALAWAVLCGYPTLVLLDLAPHITAQPWAFVLEQGFPVVYYLAGYYAHNWLRPSRGLTAAGLAALALMAVPLLMGTAAGVELMLPEYCLVLPFALWVFVSMREGLDIPIEGHRWASLLASCSFGVYVLHPLFQHVVVRLLDVESLPVLPVQALLLVTSLAGSVVMTLLLRKLPCYSDKL